MAVVLFIGDIKETLKKLSGDYLERVIRNAEDFKVVYGEFAGLETPRALLIHDISCLRGSARFAKFLEDTTNKVICCASIDNLDDMTMSRFYRVFKTPVDLRFNGARNPSGLQRERKKEQTPLMQKVLVHDPTALPVAHYVQRHRFGKRMREALFGKEPR